jgi:hypothetical protein
LAKLCPPARSFRRLLGSHDKSTRSALTASGHEFFELVLVYVINFISVREHKQSSQCVFNARFSALQLLHIFISFLDMDDLILNGKPIE